MKKSLLSLFIAIFLFYANAQTVMINLGTTTVESSALHTTSDPPWEIKYGPGDSLWMTTKNGKVYQIHPISGLARLLLDYSGTVYQAGEAGMLGMAFHTGFATNPYVYIAYTYSNGGNWERLSRFTYNGTALTNEFVLIDNIAANTIHNGSRLLVMPDNTILMTTGDAANTANSQNTSSLNGKILRVHPDGSVPANNPVAGNRLYTYGHRNAQGLMLHPNGKIYSSEHGPNNNDEFQVIEAGRNYGWPNVEGFCDNDIAGETAFCTANNVKEPLASWNPVPGGTWAPSDLIWYDHPSIPEFQNSFLVTFLKTAKTRSIRINAAGDAITNQTDYFTNQWGRLRDITTGPDGSIYIATNEFPYRIIRVRAANVTPVSVSNFQVTCGGQNFIISWTTRTEINNKQFILYKSNDGTQFDPLAVIPSLAPAGHSATSLPYKYTDNGNEKASVFYKLASEDKDGKISDWGIAIPPCGGRGNRFALLPNPATDQSKLTMSGVTDIMNITVYNSLGQVVYQNRGNGTITFPVNKWNKGLHVIVVTNNQKEVVYKNKLVVQ